MMMSQELMIKPAILSFVLSLCAMSGCLVQTGCATIDIGLSQTKELGRYAGAGVALDAGELEAEDALLKSWGVHWSEGKFLLQQPFAQPLSNRSFIVPSSWYRAVDLGEQIESAKLRRDLPLLKLVLAKAYGGYQRAENLGFDFETWIQDWDASLVAGPDRQSALDAFKPFRKLLEVQLDNHTGPIMRHRFGSGSASAVLANAPLGQCIRMKNAAGEIFAINRNDPAQQVKRARNASGAVINFLSFPAMRGVMKAVACGGVWIPLTMVWHDPQVQRSHIQDLAQANPDEPSYRRISRNIEYLRLPTFSVANVEKMLVLAGNLPADVGSSSTLMLDLRLNDGGNGMGAAPLLKPWVDIQAKFAEIGMTRRPKVSCLTMAGGWGYTQVSLKGVQPPLADELRNRLQKQLDELSDSGESDCPITYEDIKANWHFIEHKFVPAGQGKKNILVIIDSACASDCEFVTYLLSAFAHTLIVGGNTFGVAQFTQPSYFILPHSRVQFRLARGNSDLYGDSRSVDGYGLDVDMVLLTADQYSAANLVEVANSL